MRIAVTADWHGYLPPDIPECELMVVAGDIGLSENFSKFDPEVLLSDRWKWIEGQPMPIVVVAGNHDFETEILRALPWTYLQDEAATVCGLKIWGSPWSNPFAYGWAFNMKEEDQAELFRKIPDDTEIVISHSPPYGSCDLQIGHQTNKPLHLGSKALASRCRELENLKLIACGHIHSMYGREGNVVNGSLVNSKYHIANKPYLFEIDDE